MFVLYGRAFTRDVFNKALINACGGYINGAYVALLDEPLWLSIEAIEAISEIQAEASDEKPLF